MSIKELDLPNQELRGAGDPALAAEHAAEIRRLGKCVVTDIIEIGRRLTECKRICGHGNWLPWLEREFGWSDDTALNYTRVYELSESRNFRDLSLSVSSLYLLAAPSTPESARDAVLDRAANGERLMYAQVTQVIDAAKGRQPRNQVRATIHRTMKLGEAVMAKIKGTPLDNAREMDELIILNRGAAKGELTPIVKRLVEDAAAGNDVSAIAERAKITGRNEPAPPVSEEVLQERAASAERLRAFGGGKAHDDIGPESADEITRKDARSEEARHFESQNIALRSEVGELKTKVRDLETRMLRALSIEQLVAELERRPAAVFFRTHLAAIRRALDAPGRHVGPTMELGPDVTTKH